MKLAAIGVDIGGTSVKLGVVDRHGKTLFRSSFLTRAKPGRNKMLAILAGQVRALKALAVRSGHRVAGVGIGAPGPIDVERGLVYFFPNIPGWKNVPLKALLQRRLKMPVSVDNDANAMALGEFRFGAGKGVKNGIFLTLGTGVGGGLVLDGKLFHGPTFSAAEIGHISIDANGLRCGCGSRGCVETYVGNGYFTREVERRLKISRSGMLAGWKKEGRPLSPLVVAEAARRGDKLAKQMWADTGGYLGTALAGMINILNPQRIILGGGVSQSKDLLFPPLIKALKQKAFPIAFHSVRVVAAKLGVDAGLIGAASLILP